jgi:hypothetical protein
LEAVSLDVSSPEDESSATSQKEMPQKGASPLGGGDRRSFNDTEAMNSSEARRVLEANAEEVETGSLDTLNAAFDQGWRLERVVYREETDDLLFLLQQEPSSAGGSGLIV